MEFIGPILEIFKCVCPPVCKYVQDHKKLDENMKNLERVLQELNSQKEDIEATLKAEGDQGKKPRTEVKNCIEQEVKKRKYFSRARLGKDVEAKIQEMKDYYQKGCSFTSLVIDAPPASGLILPTTTLVGENTKKIVKKIWEDLMGDKVTKIGVWGMGGIVKTATMRHINNRLQEETNEFNDVIWVTVSQPLDLIKLQTEIATALKLSLTEDEDKVRRAWRLLGKLKAKKKFALILDDMWEAFPLEEVGIPEPNKQNECKLMITTRSVGVCHSMGCEEIKVQPLSKEEALNLFLDKVGRNILHVPTLSKEIINSVVEECAGLPLAIVTVAGCMRGVQHCFLYCALYPEDFPISKDELIGYWIAEGLIKEVKNVQDKYDRGYTILNRLVYCCLLESAKKGRCVKMHDLIRAIALRITSDSPLFMVQAGVHLQRFLGQQEWRQDLEKVSLVKNDLLEIPSNMSPHCEILSTLLLQRNRNLQRIPECFFAHMHGLKILNLSYTDIEVLPNSVSDLRNLRSLLLRYCRRLERVPSLAKLLALQCLDLEYTAIKEVPEGAEMLENLVSTVYNGSVANTRFYSFLRIGEVNKSVCFYRCKICEREDVTIVLPKDVRGLIMRDIEDVTSLNDVLSKEQGLVNAGKFSHLKALCFSYCPNLQKLFSLQLLPALQNLEFLVVRSCKRIEEIVEVNDEETQKELGTSAITITLPRLKKLWLSFLPELKSVCSDNAVLICNSLQEIQITPSCPKLKRLSLRLPLLDNGQPPPPPALEVIKIRKELWESLEWDQANAKEVLNPYCKFEQS
ncbi:putative disease resistance protein [Citrus sinensis]|uniref:Disease resistance protein n=1 Tax=Citrus sinensis TaxID=2711 RepID=A0ACB8JDI0_CITSI|nr:putative disease resistance protein [Citrus sinensis]